jgi:hypothetical protein
MILITLFHSSFPSHFLATPLAVSASTIQFDSGLTLETGESKTLAMSSPLWSVILSDDFTLGGGVGGSGSGAGE